MRTTNTLTCNLFEFHSSARFCFCRSETAPRQIKILQDIVEYVVFKYKRAARVFELLRFWNTKEVWRNTSQTKCSFFFSRVLQLAECFSVYRQRQRFYRAFVK